MNQKYVQISREFFGPLSAATPWLAPGVPPQAAEAILTPMGFNPHRQYHHSIGDYLMVAVAVMVCVALVAWAFFG